MINVHAKLGKLKKNKKKKRKDLDTQQLPSQGAVFFVILSFFTYPYNLMN